MTTDGIRAVLAHDVEVVCGAPAGLADPLRYRAGCSCGWSSEWFDADDHAEAAGIDHREVAVRPADATDGLIGELLDIADDIAQAAEWLAEHWPDELRAPTWYGSGGGPGHRREAIELLVACRDADELVLAATVLGTPAVDDPYPDSRGHRYRRVRRRLSGYVAVDVFLTLGEPCDACGTRFEGEVCPTCRQHRTDGTRNGALPARQAS